MASIHPLASVDAKAVLAADVHVGPFCVVGPHVVIGEGSVLESHVNVTGHTRIGVRNRFAAFCSIGGAPQDKKYEGEATRLTIGDDNTFREYCTINTGTTQDQGITMVGSHNWIMAYVHIAHDCVVGDHTIFANSAQIAGHVHIADWVILGGMSGVHQFGRIGAHAMVGAGAIVTQDVAPYCMVGGTPPATVGINSEGLRRRGFSADAINALKVAYKTVFRENLTRDEALAALESQVSAEPAVKILRDFLIVKGRGLMR
jgi:UDP-N-acetylglucosamine acyltransferase